MVSILPVLSPYGRRDHAIVRISNLAYIIGTFILLHYEEWAAAGLLGLVFTASVTFHWMPWEAVFYVMDCFIAVLSGAYAAIDNFERLVNPTILIAILISVIVYILQRIFGEQVKDPVISNIGHTIFHSAFHIYTAIAFTLLFILEVYWVWD